MRKRRGKRGMVELEGPSAGKRPQRKSNDAERCSTARATLAQRVNDGDE